MFSNINALRSLPASGQAGAAGARPLLRLLAMALVIAGLFGALELAATDARPAGAGEGVHAAS